MNDKHKEYIGDAVFSVLSREYHVNNSATSSTYTVMKNAQHICSNRMMGMIGKEIGILTDEDCNYGKDGGNKFERYVYNMYNQHGLDFCKVWFKTIVIPAYEKIYSFSEI